MRGPRSAQTRLTHARRPADHCLACTNAGSLRSKAELAQREVVVAKREAKEKADAAEELQFQLGELRAQMADALQRVSKHGGAVPASAVLALWCL